MSYLMGRVTWESGTLENSQGLGIVKLVAVQVVVRSVIPCDLKSLQVTLPVAVRTSVEFPR